MPVCNENTDLLEQYREAADYVRKTCGDALGDEPVGMILGSGLGALASRLEGGVVIPYGDIPHFPVSTVSHHKGELAAGVLEGRHVLVMNGRFHFYEGYSMEEIVFPIRMFKLLGVKTMIITNASGGISADYHPGELVCVRDHIKLCAESPSRGKNIDAIGDRFYDMTHAYDPDYAEAAKEACKVCSLDYKEGVYAYMTGPQFETPAEIKMLRMLGATLVGMSTVPEVIEASHCSMRVLCYSCVSNMAAGVTGAKITDEEVVETGKAAAKAFEKLMREILKRI